MSDSNPLPVPFTGRKGFRVPNGPTLVTVYHAETGEALTVKPVSAREGVERGVWLRTPPEPVPVEVPEPPAPPKKSSRTK